MSVMKEITIVISIHSVTTQWGALSVAVMMGSWEMELTVMVSSYGKCGKRLFKQCLISPTDINECEQNHTCDINAQCNNTVGDFECRCNDGFMGNGTHCDGKLCM